MRWVGHVAHMGGEKCIAMEFWWENLKVKAHFEQLGMGDKIISTWFLNN
jgi:hypothetical protein